jgi:hypothetical protein
MSLQNQEAEGRFAMRERRFNVFSAEAQQSFTVLGIYLKLAA